MPVQDSVHYTPGFFCWMGKPAIAEHLHRHSDIELNFVVEGEITYLIGGTLQVLKAGDLAIFWAVTPHRIIELQKDAVLGVVHLPLTDVLRWMLPQNLMNPLLHGELVLHRDDPHLDTLLFDRWSTDCRRALREVAPEPEVLETQKTVCLEIEARLRRAALALARQPEQVSTSRTHSEDFHKVEQMATFVSAHYPDPVSVEDIARAVNLHANYAMTLFKRTMGLTLLEYLTQHRLAHAQRLLITSDHTILDVALEAGFGSLSRFYAVFKKEVGMSPRHYRSQHLRG